MNLPRILQWLIAPVLSFVIGAAVGSFSSYVTVRADAATLAGRVTALEASVHDWRLEDAETARELSAQIHDATEVLTQLRIQLGPKK